MKLSEQLKRARTDRPDEWTMDRYIAKATEMEEALASIIGICSEPVIKSDEVKGRMQRLVRPSWLSELTDEVRQAAKAFKGDWPDAWIFLGSSESNDAEKEWYDWPDDLLGLPVFHCPAWLKHSGYDGEHQKILPVWKGDVSDKSGVIREFECRLAKSGDF